MGQNLFLKNKNAVGINPTAGLSGETRTPGLLNPIQARYQSALHPDIKLLSSRDYLMNYNG